MHEHDLAHIALHGSLAEVKDFAASARLAPLASLEAELSQDRPIAELERFERLWKAVLAANFARGLWPEDAREIAASQQRLGLLCKYKSYTVKSATPLGYSIFLHEAEQGFSYQRHKEHKVEIFHILDVMPGGFVYISSYEDWLAVYDTASFDAWLAGGSDERYERYAYRPQPGDMIRIDQLNVVHTVVGCVLEEFASISTDMVDRLHDQNEGRPIPGKFTRAFAEAKIRAAQAPARTRDVVLGGGTPVIAPIEPTPITGGRMHVLARGTLNVTRWEVDPGATTDLVENGTDACSLHVFSGAGALQIGDSEPLPVAAGDTLMVAPGQRYRFTNGGDDMLIVSELRIDPALPLLLEGA